MPSSILEEKWTKKRSGRAGWVGPAVAREAKRLALGHVGFRGHVEIMDFEGNVLKQFKTKTMQQIKITSDASKVYLLSPSGKIFAYDSRGEKLKKYKCREWTLAPTRHLSISEDGSMVTAGDALMDAEGNVIRFSDRRRDRIVGIAPNGTYVVVHWYSGMYIKRRYFKGTSAVTEYAEHKQDLIYIRPQDINSLSALLGWKCVQFNLNTDMGTGFGTERDHGARVCVHNSFFASARKSIGYIDLNGNLKWSFTLPQRGEIRQFYVTSDAKYLFFTLKGRKKKKNIYILDAENRKIWVKAFEHSIVNFKVTNDGKTLFVNTSIHSKHPLHMPTEELIAFDVSRKLLQQILGG